MGEVGGSKVTLHASATQQGRTQHSRALDAAATANIVLAAAIIECPGRRTHHALYGLHGEHSLLMQGWHPG